MEKTLGIRREDRNEFEGRAPLAPGHVARLVGEHGLKVLVQPSRIRAFTDDEYAGAGALVTEDIWGADLVLAVKEIPGDALAEGGTYMFFSHTIKGQKHNMSMLRRLVELKCNLLDYEKVTDDEGRRLIFFGREAGIAGMLNTLWALGMRLGLEGHATPFADVQRTRLYRDLAEAREGVMEAGEHLRMSGLPEGVGPLVCGFAGYGNVSRGAQEIFDLLPAVELSPEELVRRGDDGTLAALSARNVYKVVFREEDMAVPKDRGAPFELQDYYDNPERYEGVFEQYLPHLSVLVNCIYWDDRYPRLVTREWLRRAYPPRGAPGTRLRVIGDISCDIDGSVQATVKATHPGNPVYVYEPSTGGAVDGVEGNGPVIMAIDALPGSLPVDATEAFGDKLMEYIPDMMENDFDAPLSEYRLPDDILRSLILCHGRFTEDFAYMEEFIRQ